MRITHPKAATLEAIRPGSGGSFSVRHSCPTSFPFNWHYHPEVELTLIVRGHGLRFVGTSIEAFASGDIVLIGANVPHTWQSTPTDENVESIVVQFLPGLIQGLAGLSEMVAVERLISDAGRGLVLDGGSSHRHLTAQLRTMVETKGSIRCLAGLLDCLGHFCQAKSDSSQPGYRPLSHHLSDWSEMLRPSAQKLRRVLNRVHATLSAGHNVRQSDAAEWAGMSPASFSRLFHSEVGLPFSRYVNEWRIGLACQSLIGSSKPITEIAFDCGFGNLSNFNRRFREFKGMTPRQFRAST